MVYVFDLRVRQHDVEDRGHVAFEGVHQVDDALVVRPSLEVALGFLVTLQEILEHGDHVGADSIMISGRRNRTVTVRYGEGSLFRKTVIPKVRTRVVIPKVRYSKGPLSWRFVIPKVSYSEGSLFRRSVIPKVRNSEGPLSWRFVIPKVRFS